MTHLTVTVIGELKMPKHTFTKEEIQEIKKYLEDFDRKLYNPEFIKEFDELETLEFIDKKENIILVRNTRCGKNTLCNRARY